MGAYLFGCKHRKYLENIPVESFTDDGGIFDTRSDVFKTCKVDFSKRYTQSDTDFDIEFYNECLQHTQYLNDIMAMLSYTPSI